MIGKLRGQYGGSTGEGSIIIEVGGVGYTVRMPLGSMQALGAGIPVELSLFIHTAVREDAIDLYGFLTEDELAFFKQLMSVSGIGPKSALNILNIADVHTLKRGIAEGNAASLTKVFGIGKKSAERIVVELRDKISLEVASRPAVGGMQSDDMEVIEALMALGYSAGEVRLAIKEVGESAGSTSVRVAAVLKHIGTPATA